PKPDPGPRHPSGMPERQGDSPLPKPGRKLDLGAPISFPEPAAPDGEPDFRAGESKRIRQQKRPAVPVQGTVAPYGGLGVQDLPGIAGADRGLDCGSVHVLVQPPDRCADEPVIGGAVNPTQLQLADEGPQSIGRNDRLGSQPQPSRERRRRLRETSD